MMCEKSLFLTYEISRVSIKMLNGTNSSENCALFPFTSFFEPMQISEVVSLFSEKLEAK